MKKLLISCMCVALVFSGLSFANEDDFEEITWEELEEIKSVATKLTDEPKINSRRAIVIERNSGTILYSKNENTRCAMASTTKIMTVIVAIEDGNLKDVVKISKKAALTGGSRLGLKTR